MGRWDPELIDLLPQGMKVMASAGAGFDWVDTKSLGKKGTYDRSSPATDLGSGVNMDFPSRPRINVSREVERFALLHSSLTSDANPILDVRNPVLQWRRRLHRICR